MLGCIEASDPSTFCIFKFDDKDLNTPCSTPGHTPCLSDGDEGEEENTSLLNLTSVDKEYQDKLNELFEIYTKGQQSVQLTKRSFIELLDCANSIFTFDEIMRSIAELPDLTPSQLCARSNLVKWSKKYQERNWQNYSSFVANK